MAVTGGRLGGLGSVTGAVTVSGGATLLGGGGIAATGTLTLAVNPTLNAGSMIELTLGTGAAHSTLALSTGGFNGFNANQAFTLDNGNIAGIYDNVITGVASGIATTGWTVTDPTSGYTYRFTDDGTNIDLLVSVPEPSTWATVVLGVGAAACARRHRVKAWLKVVRAS